MRICFLILKQQNQQMQFEFPLNLDELRTVGNVAQVKSLLNRQLLGSNLPFHYRYMSRKNKYIYARCCRCRSFLRYKKEDDSPYSLSNYSTIHRHTPSTSNKNQIIEHFIKQLPIDVNLSTACKLAVSQLSQTSSRFYYYFNKINFKRVKFSSWIASLDHQQYQVHYQPFEKDKDNLPNLLIIVSPAMKSMYRKYGSVVGIDFTFKLVKETHPSGRTWKVGLVVGNSLSRKIIPFALLLTLEESSEAYYRLIKSFGNIMGSLPDVIITDQSKGALSGISQLQQDGEFEGIHVLDLFHILQNVRKKLKNKNNFSYFSRLAACSNKKSFEILLKETIENIDFEDVEVLEKFILNSSFYCLSQMKSVFIEFSSSTGSNQKIHDLIKSILPTQKPLIAVCQHILKLSDKLIEKCQFITIQKSPIEKYYNYSQLKYIRYHVDSKILWKICEQLAELITLQLLETSDKLTVTDLITNEEFEIFLDENSRYVCQCSYLNKTGIACSHIMKVCFVKRKRLIEYLNPRWLITSLEQPKFSRGRPATTRRKRK